MAPVYEVEVLVPGDYMGDVMSDLQGRRAIVQGMASEKGFEKITAKVPLAEMNKYSTSLSSLTSGRAMYGGLKPSQVTVYRPPFFYYPFVYLLQSGGGTDLGNRNLINLRASMRGPITSNHLCVFCSYLQYYYGYYDVILNLTIFTT